MKQTSVPEQAIFFYTCKYIDAKAENNQLRLERYTADVNFEYNGIKYIAEYDSYSQHHNKTEKDKERDLFFLKHGYKTIRFRDAGLDFLDSSYLNIRMVFDNYTKQMLDSANIAINNFLNHFGIMETIDIRNDLSVIRQMYRDF